MNRKLFTSIGTISAAIGLSLLLAGCDPSDGTPQSSSGVSKATVQIAVDPNTGHTTEQQNIIDRNTLDNKPGSIKHLYIISPDSGQVLIYSTVRGKVTSSGKRLSPRTVNGSDSFTVDIGGERHYTNEVLEDDGTYGNSVDYIYWFDSAGRYHQHFFTGGQIITLSDYPIAVKNVVLNLELAAPPAAGATAPATTGQGAPAK